ncbi:3-hydroxyisobutyryl-CoA hydrolase 1-like isoform X1 [Zingiber officinale]|uniref:3-hydroxyisobutyryl-CoA hydrolase 1-like isoform X1 n=1 Tax=Zingiber officinale TaxID=94328 RepID=UPI001C4D2C1C|nr:3-hydroxyisobutyryl-CoA hydrolase 1-like isoform X1 [Zingiber officinale]
MTSFSQDGGNEAATDQVLVEGSRFTRILILNRPRQLNALSSQMIMKLLNVFVAYEKDPDVKLLIVKGNGRAFCAGGDVAAVVQSVTEGDWTMGAEYFRNEYTLNYIIATYSKPQVSILDGIVMGGGAGVSVHGRFRIATEKTVFAMPETSLGLFPDVGASYFLSRLPGYFGEYVGLTGTRLDGTEMLASGLATHFVSSTNLKKLEESLSKVETSDPFAICACIDQFSKAVSLKATSSYNRMDVIDKCFSKETVEAIIVSLEKEAESVHDEWIMSTILSMKKASPISLKITLRSIREARRQGVDKCLINDYRLCCHILRQEASKDFFEGCRAILVDKDKNPKWEPSRLDQVDDKVVDRYFVEVGDANWEDLKLPARHSLAAKYVSRM